MAKVEATEESAPNTDSELGEETVYEPHSHGVPPLRPYFRGLWERRSFLVHMARSELKARHFDSFFGQAWHILNPLLLALVYFLLVNFIRGSSKADFFPFLIAGLFSFYFTMNAVNVGAKSVVGGSGLLLNSNFPRALLPVSSVLSALLMYVPTLGVYAIFHLAFGEPIGPQLVLVPVIVALQVVINLGLALFLGSLTVYFRDTSSFLPYFLRIWLYLSPVLWAIDDVPDGVRGFMNLNPMFPILGAWHQVINAGVWPSEKLLALGAAWSVGILILGTWFFLSREREFAVRI